jgi:hypothetical protein
MMHNYIWVSEFAQKIVDIAFDKMRVLECPATEGGQ